MEQEQIRHSELTFQLIVESSPNAIVLVNKEGKISYINNQTEKLFGYSKAELIGQMVEILIPQRYRDKHMGFRTDFFGSPSVRSMGAGRELFALRKDKTEFPIEIGLNPLITVDGTMVLASIIDITERKKAEERFRLVVESAPNAMVLVNQEGTITMVNRQSELLFGYQRNELNGQRLEVLIPERFRDHHPDLRNSFFGNPQTRSMGAGRELFARRKNGTEIQVEIGLNPIETPEGQLVLASIIDITERKRADERFRLVVESAPNAMILVNHEGIITLVNKQVEVLFGYNQSELIGNNLGLLLPERFSDIHTAYADMYFRNPWTRPMGEGRDLFARRKNGTEVQVEIGLNPIDTNEGQLVLASIIDITQRKIQEATLKRQVELEIKNEELEQFAYVASHDLQEPLRTVSNYMQVFEEDYVEKLDDKARKYIKSVNNATRRMSTLVKALLDFSRLGRNRKLVRVDCELLINNVISDLKTLVENSGATIEVGKMPSLPVYEIEFTQLFQNLISNAIKFRKNNTRPEVRITCVRANEKYQFSVTDNGIGIMPVHFGRIFDIFQRLHPDSEYEGNGIGLANCKKIVELHQGEIWVDSKLEKGTTFNFIIPQLVL
ncbi:MAG TPA: PAS domain S-box protein [Cyclobacteriaceae bacterium]